MDDLRETTRAFYRRALAEKGWTPYRLAKEAGIASTSITRVLNDENYKFVPKLDTLNKVAIASGVNVPESLRLPAPMDIVPLRRSIPVLGDVSAGAWKQIPDSPVVEEELFMEVPEYAGATLFALRVSGRSMDLVYPDGTYVVLAPPAEAGLRLGDRVAIRRTDAAGFCETTLKELAKDGNGLVALQPRSSDPEQQEWLPMPSDENSDVGVEIIGVVVVSYTKERRGTGPLLRL